MYSNLLKSIKIGNLELKNRVSFAPTSMGLNLEEKINKFCKIAKSGVALITIGDVSVRPSFHKMALSLSDEDGIREYKKIVDAIHDSGAKVSAQIFCSDYNMNLIRNTMKLGITSHDEIKKIMHDGVKNYVTNMPKEEIKNIIELFRVTALNAKKAGFDMIQIHGDRLVGSFSSSIYNNRTDEYGGSCDNRSRFASEIISSISNDIKDIPIDYKLAIRQENPHYGNAGVLFSEVEDFVKKFESLGVNSFHVTLANHSKLEDTIPINNHPYFKDEGCFLYLADEVKKYTTLPVCGVGKLSSPDFIESVISNNRVDMIAMSRQLLADSDWLQKVREGRVDDIKKCCYCNKKCADELQKHSQFGCILD